MAGSANLAPSREVLRFKPTPDMRQFLLSLPMGERSAYIRRAFEAYMERHPVVTAIPLDEGASPVEAEPVGFTPTDRIVEWLKPVPPFMRSYLIRHVIRTYAKQQGEGSRESVLPQTHQLTLPLAAN